MTLANHFRHRPPGYPLASRSFNRKNSRNYETIRSPNIVHTWRRTSTSTPGSSTTTPTPTTSSSSSSSSSSPPPPIQPPRVISRRAWQEYQKKNVSLFSGPSAEETAKKKATEAAQEKPWPKSVVYTGYVLGGTLIPYFCTWLAVTNESTRSYLLKLVGPKLEQILRNHFGKPEWSSVPYPEQVGQKLSSLPHTLLGEIPLDDRLQQQRIDEDLSTLRTETVRVCLYRDEDVASSSVDGRTAVAMVDEARPLSVTTLCKPENILPSTVEQLPTGTSIAVEFQTEEETNEATLANTLDNDEGSATTTTTVAASDPTTVIDPLRTKINPYSLWHYIPVADPAATQQVSFRISEHEFQMAELQNDIFLLEAELRSGNSGRSVDNIMADLDNRKNRLRRLKWRKWLPW